MGTAFCILIFQEGYVQSREGDVVTDAPDLKEVEVVQDPNQERTTMGEVQIFSCYCGDHFITSASYAKHAASHASGEWEPETDESGDVASTAHQGHQEVSKDFKIKMSDQKSKSMTSRLTEVSSSSPGRERVMATQAETLEWHKKRWGQRSSNLLLPPFPCPAFSSLAMMEDSFSEWVFISESFKEDYMLLLFLPMDGNVDKAELEAFSAELDQLASLGCQVGNLN